MHVEFGDTNTKPEVGDLVDLQKMKGLEVVACQETGVPMLNVDADQLQKGDLTFIKKLGLTISNPDTDKPVALGVDYQPETIGEKVSKFFSSDDDSSEDDSDEDDNDDDDDSSFFHSSTGSFMGALGTGLGGFSGGFSGGFGGFGGGSFGGGGASRGF